MKRALNTTPEGIRPRVAKSRAVDNLDFVVKTTAIARCMGQSNSNMTKCTLVAAFKCETHSHM